MNVVFLRGSVPPANEHPEKLLYSNIEECEDVWTQFFYYFVKEINGFGLLLYQGKLRKFKVDKFFTERWVSSLVDFIPSFYPDLIICRGGFPYYDSFVTRFPKAKKIYYGAGLRYFPTSKFKNYNLFLTDSIRQLKDIKRKGRNADLFIKPAASLFYPRDSKKIYDLCFIANASQEKIKRHKLFLKSFAGTKYKILNLGNTNAALIKMAKDLKVDVTWGGWSLRKHLPEKISQCSVGVCCSTNYDSCPRVIPEYLACGLPVVVTSNVNVGPIYIEDNVTGLFVKEDELRVGVKKALQINSRSVINYYNEFLSLKASVKDFIEKVNKI